MKKTNNPPPASPSQKKRRIRVASDGTRYLETPRGWRKLPAETGREVKPHRSGGRIVHTQRKAFLKKEFLEE